MSKAASAKEPRTSARGKRRPPWLFPLNELEGAELMTVAVSSRVAANACGAAGAATSSDAATCEAAPACETCGCETCGCEISGCEIFSGGGQPPWRESSPASDASPARDDGSSTVGP